MSRRTIYVEGELYLSLEAVAEVYAIQVTWLREAYEHGLFGAGVDADASVCVAAVQLDRVSTVIRMHHVLGLDLETIQLSLDEGRHA